MKRRLSSLFKRRKKYAAIDPDQVFLDSSSSSKFNRYQCEGRLEKPLPVSSFVILAGLFILVGIVFSGKLWNLQIAQGGEFREMSENNLLRNSLIFSERGLLYDRNGEVLAWNEHDPERTEFARRVYTDLSGFGHLLGYMKYPAKDTSGFYYQTELVGIDGMELLLDDRLAGENGLKLVETNARNEISAESTVYTPETGENVTLSVDMRLQEAMHGYIKQIADSEDYEGGSGVIMNAKTGEVLVMTNYPEYSPEVMTQGDSNEEIQQFLEDTRNPFLNRAVSGVFTPGSIIKPFIATGVLEEDIINPTDNILSTGELKVENPYVPGQYTIFKDWKAHGLVDLRRALAVSSNIYFYVTGGGYKDQDGLGITRIGQYVDKFGFGEYPGSIWGDEEARGTVPSPEWKAEQFADGTWRLGDTYLTAIGQFGFQVSPLQVAKATAGIATGELVTPVFEKGVEGEKTKVDLSDRTFKIVREGMRDAVVTDYGTARGLNFPFVDVAAKTGTAELGASKANVNMWSEGYWPRNNPEYVFVVMMQNGDRHNTIGSVAVMNLMLDWMGVYTPEYFE